MLQLMLGLSNNATVVEFKIIAVNYTVTHNVADTPNHMYISYELNSALSLPMEQSMSIKTQP